MSLPTGLEEGTLLDILGDASDETLRATQSLYVLYDQYGKLTLQHIEKMQLPILVDEDTAAEYSYTSSIDKNTFNRIRIAADSESAGQREVYDVNDEVTQRKWGILQYYQKAREADAAPGKIQESGKRLLSYFNQKTRQLSIKKCFGDIRVRGGSSLVVKMRLGNINMQNFMLVEKVRHQFCHGSHLMDLDVTGIRGEFHV